MTRYELLLFLHVAAAIVWIGAALTIQLLAFRARTARDTEAARATAEGNEWLAMRVFVPSALSVFVLGVLLTIDGPWGFDQLWILIGIAGYLASFGVGILYFKPEGARVGALMAEGDPNRELQWRIHRLTVVSWAELVILFLVVADMTIKPTSDDVGILAVGAAVLVATAVLSARAIRQASPGSRPASAALD